MTQLHFDMNEAAKYIDMPIKPLTTISHTCTKYKIVTILSLTFEKYSMFLRQLKMSEMGKILKFCDTMWGEWLSGLYSLRQVTAVKLGRVRSDSGLVTSEV